LNAQMVAPARAGIRVRYSRPTLRDGESFAAARALHRDCSTAFILTARQLGARLYEFLMEQRQTRNGALMAVASISLPRSRNRSKSCPISSTSVSAFSYLCWSPPMRAPAQVFEGSAPCMSPLSASASPSCLASTSSTRFFTPKNSKSRSGFNEVTS